MPTTAYIVSRYPAVSHTFIRREVAALRRTGWTVRTFSVRTPGEHEVLHEADRAERDTTTFILPLRPGVALRTAWALARVPSAFVAAVRTAQAGRAPGLRGRAWALFYAVEAAVVWAACDGDGITHLHAHFANVGADLARAATALGNAADAARGRPPGADGRGRWRWSFTMHGPTELYDVAAYGLAAKAADADLVACISDFCRSQLLGLVDEDRWDRFHVVHCGIEPASFNLPAPPVDGPFTIACVGRLVPEKGQAILLEALARLVADGVDARVRFVGTGPRLDALRAEASRLGLADRAAFLGARPPSEVRAVLAESHVFCLPSFAEGVPVVLMEAMAARRPVVTTRIAGIPELVQDGVSGFVVAPGRVDLITAALATLAADPARRQAMGQAGREAVEAGFDVDDAAAVLRDRFLALDRSADR